MRLGLWRQLIAPLEEALVEVLRRALLTLSQPAKPLQQMQGTAIDDTPLDGEEYYEPYGFTGVPLKGAELIAAEMEGKREDVIVLVAADRRYRPTDLTQGEVCVYTDEGDRVHFKRGNTIHIKSKKKVHVDAPEVVADCTNATVNAKAGITTQSKTLDATATASANITTANLVANASSATTVTSPNITLNGNVSINGMLSVMGLIAGALGITAPSIAVNGIKLEQHKHPYTDDGTPMKTGGPQ